MPVGGFRSFANEINSKGPSSSVMPTYENFRKDFKHSPKTVKKRNSTSHEQNTYHTDYMHSTDFTGRGLTDKTDRIPGATEERHQWEKYFFDLNHKVKSQRDLIKKMDSKLLRMRQKSFDAELEMRVFDRV